MPPTAAGNGSKTAKSESVAVSLQVILLVVTASTRAELYQLTLEPAPLASPILVLFESSGGRTMK